MTTTITTNIDLDALLADLLKIQSDIAASVGGFDMIDYVVCPDPGQEGPTEVVVPIATIREWCDRLDAMALAVQEA